MSKKKENTFTRTIKNIFSHAKEETSPFKEFLKSSINTFETLSTPYIIFDSNNKIVSVNEATLELLDEKIKPVALQDIFSKKNFAPFIKHAGNTLKNTAPSSFKTLLTGAKKEVAVRADISFLGVEPPLEYAAVSFMQDSFTDENGIPQADAPSLKEAFAETPSITYIRDVKGNVIMASHQAKEVLGLISSKSESVMAKEFVEKDIRHDIEVIKKQTHDEETITYINKNGTTRIAIIKKVPLFFGAKKPSAVLTILSDNTDSLNREAETVNSRNLLKNILDNAPMAIYTRGALGGVTFWNKKTTEIFEDDEETIKRPGAHPMQNKEEADSYQTREEEILKEGKVVIYPQEAYTTRNGHKLMLHITKVPLKATNETPASVLSIVQDITERYIQEQETAKTQNLLQTILNNAPLAVYARDENGNILFRNKKTNEVHGFKIGETPKETQDQIDYYRNRENSIFKGKKPVILGDEEYVGADGKKRIIRAVKAPVFDREEKPLMIVTIGEDVTETKEKEKELLHTKNFLNEVVDNLPVALFAKDYEGKYILWNKKSAEVFGKTAGEVLGKMHHNEEINPEQLEFIHMQDQKVFDMHQELDIPQELISTQNSGIKIMHTVKTPLYYEGGKPHCLLGISEDITAKTKMEKQVYETKTQYSLLVENCREGILSIEQDKITFANKTILNALGYKEDEIKGKPFIDLIAQENKAIAQEFYDKISAATSAQDFVTFRMQTKNEDIVEFEASAVRSKYLGKRIVIMFLRNITRELKQDNTDKRTKETKFREVFENIKTPLVILQKNGYVYEMNQAARQLLGFNKEDRTLYGSIFVMPGLPLEVRHSLENGKGLKFNTTIDFDRIRRTVSSILKTGTLNLTVNMQPFNERKMASGKQTTDFLMELSKVEDQTSPEVSATTVSSDDILTYQDAVILCTRNGEILKANVQAEHLFNRNFLSLQGINIADIFNKQSSLCIKKDIEELYNQGNIKSREYTLNKDFGALSLEAGAMLAKDNNFLISFRNNTIKRQLLDLLQERSSYSEALKKSLNGAILECNIKNDTLSNFTEISPIACLLSGYSKQELSNLNLQNLLCEDKDEKEVEKTQAYLTTRARRLKEGKTVAFEANLNFKGRKTSCLVTLSPYQTRERDKVLVILKETAKEHALVNDLDNAENELEGIKEVMEGMYLKLDKNGVVEEFRGGANKNFANILPSDLLGKTPNDFLSSTEAKDMMSNISSAFKAETPLRGAFSLQNEDTRYFYEYSVSRLKSEDKLIMLINNVDERKGLENKIKRLYFLSARAEKTFVENMDEILQYGKQLFGAQAGLICHFSGRNKEGILVNYVTENDLGIKKNIATQAGECLRSVREGKVFASADLSTLPCEDCLHTRNNLKAILVAPLYIRGKVEGAMCFVSNKRNKMHLGGEEQSLMSFMGGLMSMALETRQANKAANYGLSTMRKFMETLDVPSLIIDSSLNITNLNDTLRDLFGIYDRIEVEGKNVFQQFATNSLKAEGDFKSSYKLSKGGAFDFMFELNLPQNRRLTVIWHVVEIRDGRGKVRGFLLASENIKGMDL